MKKLVIKNSSGKEEILNIVENHGCLYIVKDDFESAKSFLMLRLTSRNGKTDYIRNINNIAENIRRTQILHALRLINRYYPEKNRDYIINLFYPKILDIITMACRDKIQELKFLGNNKQLIKEFPTLFIRAEKEMKINGNSLVDHLNKIMGGGIIKEILHGNKYRRDP